MVRNSGRREWHVNIWRENHEKLKRILRQEKNGIRKIMLHKISGLSRPTIEKHIQAFGDNIRYERGFLFWITAYERSQKWAAIEGLLDNLKANGIDPEGFFKNNCIAFIGDVPGTLPKSVEGMQSHLAFVRSLHERHQRDLEPYREEYIRARMKNGEKGSAAVELRIKDEVGWTVEEYLKKLLKKAEGEKGILKIMTVLGITDEMLKEMYSQGT